MPTFIGNIIQNVQTKQESDIEYSIPVTFAQAILLDPKDLRVTLNTSDKGSRGRKAKRWNNWFTTPEAIIVSKHSSDKMKTLAYQELLLRAHKRFASIKRVAIENGFPNLAEFADRGLKDEAID